VGRGRGGRRPPLFSTGGTRPPLPHFWTEIRAKVSPLLQWLLTETQCKNNFSTAELIFYVIVNLRLSLVSGVPHFVFRTTPLLWIRLRVSCFRLLCIAVQPKNNTAEKRIPIST